MLPIIESRSQFMLDKAAHSATSNRRLEGINLGMFHVETDLALFASYPQTDAGSTLLEFPTGIRVV
jgi:hypothetical protein